MQVNFHGAFPDSKLDGDTFIREPLRDEPGYFRLPSRQRLIINAVSKPTFRLAKHSTLPLEFEPRSLW